MRELDLETIRLRRHGSTHFVKWINEEWSGRGGECRTYCGRQAPVSEIAPQKFSAVRDWCLPCYWSRHRAIDREFGIRTGGPK